MKTWLGCRANGAEDASPGQRPGYCALVSFSAVEGRRVPAPFQGAKYSIDYESQGDALG